MSSKKENEPRKRTVTKPTDESENKKEDKKEDKKQPDEVKPKKIAKVKRTQLIVAIIFIIYELMSTILYLVLLYNRNQFMKTNLYDPELSQPDSVIKVYHFIFHCTLIVFIISLIVYAYKDIINKHPTMISFFSVFGGTFSLVFWAAYAGVYFVTIKDNKKVIVLDELKEILNTSSPTEYAFIYAKENIKIHNCSANPLTGIPICSDRYEKCYSYSGVKFPFKSELASERFTFSNPPGFFYFNIRQTFTMSEECQTQFNKTIAQIKRCNDHQQRIKYFPEMNKTYTIANPTIPQFVSGKILRIAGYIGAGMDYDLFIKSFPFIRYNQRINLDLDPEFNYSKVWTKRSCHEFGKCSIENKKPFPSDEL